MNGAIKADSASVRSLVTREKSNFADLGAMFWWLAILGFAGSGRAEGKNLAKPLERCAVVAIVILSL